MSLAAFRLVNFMAFADTDWIELRPITMLFGKNSSGKSAIIRALRLLKQSLFSPDDKANILTLQTEELDCGSFATIIHRDGLEPLTDEQVDSRPMMFGFRCSPTPEMVSLIQQFPHQEKVEKFLQQNQQSGACFVELLISVRQSGLNQQIIFSGMTLQLSFDSGDAAVAAIKIKCVAQDLDSRFAGGSWVWSDLFEIPQKRSIGLRSDTAFLPAFKPDNALLENGRFIDELLTLVKSEISDFLQAIEYLGPIRPEPRRIYAIDNLAQLRLEKQGLRTWIKYLKSGYDLEVNTRIAKSLVDMDLCKDARIDPGGYTEKGILSEITVTDVSTGLPFNVREVGYGTSQVLPVVATSFLSQPESLVIVEQPELHLHPRAQASLANVFVEVIHDLLDDPQDKTSQKYRNVRFLLETHSEHMLTRLRRCIAETAIGQYDIVKDANRYLLSQDVGVYFVHRGNVCRIDFDAYGDFSTIPDGFDGFFSNDLDDIVAFTQAKFDAQELGV